MSSIYLIRHAQQVENFIPTEGQLYAPPLTQIGVTQAEHLRDRLAATHEIQADILISSSLLRARTTAEIIAPALDLPVVLDDDFQEFLIGNREGIADKDIGEIFGLEPIPIGSTILGLQTTHSRCERSGCRISGKMFPGSGSCMNEEWCGEIGFVDGKNTLASCCRMMRYNGAEWITAVLDTGQLRTSGRC